MATQEAQEVIWGRQQDEESNEEENTPFFSMQFDEVDEESDFLLSEDSSSESEDEGTDDDDLISEDALDEQLWEDSQEKQRWVQQYERKSTRWLRKYGSKIDSEARPEVTARHRKELGWKPILRVCFMLGFVLCGYQWWQKYDEYSDTPVVERIQSYLMENLPSLYTMLHEGTTENEENIVLKEIVDDVLAPVEESSDENDGQNIDITQDDESHVVIDQVEVDNEEIAVDLEGNVIVDRTQEALGVNEIDHVDLEENDTHITIDNSAELSEIANIEEVIKKVNEDASKQDDTNDDSISESIVVVEQDISTMDLEETKNATLSPSHDKISDVLLNEEGSILVEEIHLHNERSQDKVDNTPSLDAVDLENQVTDESSSDISTNDQVGTFTEDSDQVVTDHATLSVPIAKFEWAECEEAIAVCGQSVKDMVRLHYQENVTTQAKDACSHAITISAAYPSLHQQAWTLQGDLKNFIRDFDGAVLDYQYALTLIPSATTVHLKLISTRWLALYQSLHLDILREECEAYLNESTAEPLVEIAKEWLLVLTPNAKESSKDKQHLYSVLVQTRKFTMLR
ncbi:hypothetical protein THRCLA_07762 [Thraustotheca clavata]|uniref:Uncharacterized protein n=1 Tax=Thraustotheca clavata TaxID=74557 RepID=A0A1V9ZC28_9STRA|nr:hypothetical protein THRCLA_07762 [Thraustotheca clavata]